MVAKDNRRHGADGGNGDRAYDQTNPFLRGRRQPR